MRHNNFRDQADVNIRVVAVYLDDLASGITVFGNVFPGHGAAHRFALPDA